MNMKINLSDNTIEKFSDIILILDDIQENFKFKKMDEPTLHEIIQVFQQEVSNTYKKAYYKNEFVVVPELKCKYNISIDLETRDLAINEQPQS